jgi:general secretion pathway protein G
MKRVFRCSVLALVLSFYSGCTLVKPASKETLLKEDLYSIRTAIDQFTQTEKHAPMSLDDLVSHGYLRGIPSDPFTNSQLTWQIVYDDIKNTQDRSAVHPKGMPKAKGIVDIYSGSHDIGRDGTRYSTW